MVSSEARRSLARRRLGASGCWMMQPHHHERSCPSSITSTVGQCPKQRMDTLMTLVSVTNARSRCDGVVIYCCCCFV